MGPDFESTTCGHRQVSGGLIRFVKMHAMMRLGGTYRPSVRLQESHMQAMEDTSLENAEDKYRAYHDTAQQ